MPRILLSALLLLIVGIALSRDATWPPLVNEASAENVIQAYLDRPPRFPCDCAAPTPECEQGCNTPREDFVWVCGTPAMQADAEIQDAMASGAAPWRIARLIQQHPDYPFGARYVLLDYSLEQSLVR